MRCCSNSPSSVMTSTSLSHRVSLRSVAGVAVKYGLELPTGYELADPVALADLARLAETRGWDGIFLEDYVCYGGDRAAPTVDTWMALAAMASATERVILGTGVTAIPRRRPWNVARQAVAIDQLSAGRLVLGAGLGDTGESVVEDASLVAFGEEGDVRVRAEMLDEALQIIAGLWTGEPFTFSGRHYSVDDVVFRPTPVQRPRIPIWIGGGFPSRGPRSERCAGTGHGCTATPAMEGPTT